MARLFCASDRLATSLGLTTISSPVPVGRDVVMCWHCGAFTEKLVCRGRVGRAAQGKAETETGTRQVRRRAGRAGEREDRIRV